MSAILPVVAVIGASGTGKTALAVELARHLRTSVCHCHIINADAIQVCLISDHKSQYVYSFVRLESNSSKFSSIERFLSLPINQPLLSSKMFLTIYSEFWNRSRVLSQSTTTSAELCLLYTHLLLNPF